MPLTNAEKQKRHRQKRDATIARYEAALREIAALNPWDPAVAIAKAALTPAAQGDE